jgi:hypothetical protein
MPYYRMDQEGFWDDITDPALRWTQELARRSGMEIGAIRMGSQTEERPPMAQLLQVPPGGVVPKHSHDCVRVEVLVRGSLDVGNGLLLYPGDVMISQPGEFYGPNVAGPEGATTVEIFSDCTAKTVFADADMRWVAELATRGQEEFVEKARAAAQG